MVKVDEYQDTITTQLKICHSDIIVLFQTLGELQYSIDKINFKDAFYSIRLLKETFAPETPQTDRLADANWTPGCWSGIGSGSSQEDVHTDEIPEVSDDVVADFNEGMAKIARHSKREDLTPLTFQLSTTWEEAIPDERKTCIEKATKACEVICSVIAPKDGEKLFQAIRQPTANDLDEPTEDLIALMSAYRDAMKRMLRFKYSASTLIGIP